MNNLTNNHASIARPKIAIISFSPIQQDARVLRQITYLSALYSILVVGYGGWEGPLKANVEMFSVPAPAGLKRYFSNILLLLLGRLFPKWAYETWYWGRPHHQMALTALLKNRASIIHANEWNALPLAIKVAQETGARVLLDLHEYSPLEGEDRWFWRLLYKPAIEYFLRNYTPYISASVTINEMIAAKYATEYNFRPIVVMNAPQGKNVPTFNQTNAEQIKLIHHGYAIRYRKLELMIEAMAGADSRYSLHFMLIESTRGYLSQLKELAQRIVPGRVFFHQPVPPSEIVTKLSEYDMGIFLLPVSRNFNNFAVLPNKFFDFIMSGLAVCIGPSPEMVRLTQQFGFGVIVPSFEPQDIAAALNRLTVAEIDQMKLNAIEARQVLNADVELGKLMALYEKLLNESFDTVRP